jgi:thiamine-phosphate pyrophosphorylase
MLTRGLYVVTDCERLSFAAILERTGAMLHTGVAAVQYRDKQTATGERIPRAERLHELCARHGTPLIINDDVEVAAAVAAEGLHVGGEDLGCAEARARLGDAAIIGVSCYNSLERALAARDAGAGYVAFGAFFPTASKQRTTPVQPELLRRARQELDLPLCAIGGITPDNCEPLLEAGADLLAVISSVYQADDPCAVVARFNELIQSV